MLILIRKLVVRILLGLLNKGLRTNGGQIHLGCRMEALLSSEGNKIGVKYKTPNNQSDQIRALNVIIAYVGFQANLQLRPNYLQKSSEGICQRNAKTGNGDVLTMALEPGGATTNMGTFYGQVLSQDKLFNNNLWRYLQPDMLCGDGIIVLGNGSGFTDEGDGEVCLANQMESLMSL